MYTICFVYAMAPATRHQYAGTRGMLAEMDAAADEELRALRARAYGPAADILGDFAALQRLRQLEGRAPDHEGDPADAVTPDLPPGTETSVEPPTANETADAADPGASTQSDAPTGRPRRRLAALWVASVLVSSALAAAITYTLTAIPPVSDSPGEQIATLEPNSSVTIPTGWFDADEDTLVFDFYELTVFTRGIHGYPAPYSGCLSVVRTDLVPAEEDFDPSGWSFSGEHYYNCGIGEFTPVVLVPFDYATPDEVNSRYPTATALRFVLDDDRIGVFVDGG